MSIAATRMLAQVLHEEAQVLGVRLQMLSVDAPVWTADNVARACAGWHSALGVGRGVVSLLSSSNGAARGVVEYAPTSTVGPPPMMACDYASVLRTASGAPGSPCR